VKVHCLAVHALVFFVVAPLHAAAARAVAATVLGDGAYLYSSPARLRKAFSRMYSNQHWASDVGRRRPVRLSGFLWIVASPRRERLAVAGERRRPPVQPPILVADVK